MNKVTLVLALLAGVAVSPLAAQKARPAPAGPDADGDGVADTADRCPGTLANTRVGRDGCALTLNAPTTPAPGAAPGAVPATPAAPAPRTDSTAGAAGKTRRPTPSLVGGPPVAQPGAPTPQTPPAAAPGSVAAPAEAPASSGAVANPPAPSGPPVSTPAQPTSPVVTVPQAAAPPAPPVNAFSAGLAVAPFAEGASAPEYGRTIALGLDSAIVTLVNVFRGTTGQPLAGAMGPEAISGRERDRWSRCRALYWDLTTYRAGLSSALDAFDATPAVASAAADLEAALGHALVDTAAVVECDNVSSMIAAPGRWTPWEAQYQQAARHFYGDWYADVRNVHEKTRAFAVALRGTLPANRRFTVPAALQRNAPYAGAGPR